MNWQGKRVLVAGGAGMIGSHMARELLKRGARVTVADDLSSGSLHNIKDIQADVQFEKTDLRRFYACKRVSMNKDCIFQFAADMGGIGYITQVGADLMFNNSRINMNMLRAASVNEVTDYFFSSSACVYPEYKQKSPQVVPLKEEDAFPAMPDQFYGWEKLYCEKLVEACQRDWGMDIKVARFHNIYGEVYTAFDKQRGKAPCHLIMKAIKHPNPNFVIWGDGKSTRSFLYIDDCIEAVLRLMDSEYNEPINIGSDRLVTVNELAQIIIDISGKNIIPEYDPYKPQGVRGRNSDPTIMKKVLSWMPTIDLEVGLKSTYEWALRNFNELEGI